MLVRTSTILECKAEAGDDTLAIREALFDPRTGALRFVVLDIGHWLHEIDVLVSTREMGEIDVSGRRWPTDLSREAIEAAPHWSDRKTHVWGLGLDSWPPLIVGPFGSTYSPILMEAQAAAAFTEDAAPNVSKVQGLEPISGWQGMTAFGEDGELGTISDFVMDADSHVIHHVVLRRGGTFSHTDAVLPFARLRHRAEGQDHAVFDAVTADVETAPDPGTLDIAG